MLHIYSMAVSSNNDLKILGKFLQKMYLKTIIYDIIRYKLFQETYLVVFNV